MKNFFEQVVKRAKKMLQKNFSKMRFFINNFAAFYAKFSAVVF
jgi:hypothetical protein